VILGLSGTLSEESKSMVNYKFVKL